VKVIDYFVDVAKECINIGNFNSAMAIIGEYQFKFALLFLHGW